MNESIFKRKILVVILVIFFAFLVLIFRLFSVQILNNSKYTTEAAAENSFTNTMPSLRGIIESSDGSILADNTPVYDVYVSLNDVVNKSQFVDKLNSVLGVSKSYLRSLFKTKLIWVKVASDITKSQKNSLSSLPYLTFEMHEQRYYPNGSLFAHVLGFLGRDYQGQISGFYGIEGYFNGALLGKNGYTQGIESALGIPLLSQNYKFVPPVNGDTIKLTINPAIQNIVTSSIDYWSKKEDATSGAAIVMDPKTGAILAMSSYPSFNPNQYWKYKYANFQNNATSFIYEPGSVGKLITVSAALQTGKMTPSTTVDDATGVFNVGGKKIYNWNKLPDGVMNWAQILFQSSNVGASIVATKYLSAQTMYDFSKKFGFGSLTGITLQGEETGTVPNYTSWNETDLATDSFGQFVTVSPLQIIDAYDAIANGGKIMQPYVVQSLTTASGQTENYTPKVLYQPISSTVASEINKMLIYTTGGEPNWALHQEGVGAYMPIIAGKTGSAQMPSLKHPGQYSTHNYVMTYVAYAPANDPKFIMLTMMNSPQKPLLNQYYAATTACVEWGQIASKLFPYFGISS
jgi:cell division protein FtsI/penicillin-binding protein 2